MYKNYRGRGGPGTASSDIPSDQTKNHFEKVKRQKNVLKTLTYDFYIWYLLMLGIWSRADISISSFLNFIFAFFFLIFNLSIFFTLRLSSYFFYFCDFHFPIFLKAVFSFVHIFLSSFHFVFWNKFFVPIHYKIAALSNFGKICQKCILFGRYFLTPLTPGICFYQIYHLGFRVSLDVLRIKIYHVSQN